MCILLQRFPSTKSVQYYVICYQYLATPESQSLRVDLIRFIVGVIHPTNELLCSDIIPRWAIIGWLLTTCTSLTASANIKLALFYDWLFYDAEKDNIMNIGELCVTSLATSAENKCASWPIAVGETVQNRKNF